MGITMLLQSHDALQTLRTWPLITKASMHHQTYTSSDYCIQLQRHSVLYMPMFTNRLSWSNNSRETMQSLDDFLA